MSEEIYTYTRLNTVYMLLLFSEVTVPTVWENRLNCSLLFTESCPMSRNRFIHLNDASVYSLLMLIWLLSSAHWFDLVLDVKVIMKENLFFLNKHLTEKQKNSFKWFMSDFGHNFVCIAIYIFICLHLKQNWWIGKPLLYFFITLTEKPQEIHMSITS